MSVCGTILIVDDQDANRRLLSDLVIPLGHTPVTAEDGVAGLEALEEQPIDLVLLDIMMPRMDGYEALERIRGAARFEHLPVIVVSGVDEMDSVVRCIKAGADDYLTKPFNPVLLRARVDACLEKKRAHDQQEEYRLQIERYNEELETRVREQVQEISAMQFSTIFAMSKLAESRDPETGEHLERMREYTRVLSRELQQTPKHAAVISEELVGNLYAAAPLHDIGKVGIPDRILQKPGRLTPEEFELMKLHTSFGADTLRAVDERHPNNTFIRVGIAVAESHHEKWNGAGYPRGLAGEAIPLPGRILALADVYDALTSKRCYKEAFSHEKSRGIIVEERGQHFDPDVVDVFVAREDEFVAIRQRFQDSEKELLA